MSTKKKAEEAIRALCHEWAATLPYDALYHPSFSAFRAWLRFNGHERLLSFHSTMGAADDAEKWFDDELGQIWRR